MVRKFLHGVAGAKRSVPRNAPGHGLTTFAPAARRRRLRSSGAIVLAGWLFWGPSVVLADLGAEGLPARQARVAAMSRSEFGRLQRNFETYQGLTEPERDELRRLYHAVDEDPELATLMDSYRNWLRTLSPGQRSSLLNLPAPERAERIAAILKEQRAVAEERRAGRQRTLKASREMMEHMATLRAFYKWLGAWVDTRGVGPEPPAAIPEGRGRSLSWPIWYAATQGLFRDFPVEAVPDEEFQRLVDQLGEKARLRVGAAGTVTAGQREQLARWLRAALLRGNRMAFPNLEPLAEGKVPEIMDALSNEEQEWFERIPDERLARELAKVDYLLHPPGDYSRLQFPSIDRTRFSGMGRWQNQSNRSNPWLRREKTPAQ